MNYAQTIDYLLSQLPMFQRVGASAFKKDLTNTIVLCAALGNPHAQFPSIHIAGTNGKGSTAHALAAVLQAAGYKTGLYISPHYRDFRERIKINGEYISEAEVVAFTERCQPLFEQIKPSFFEMTVAMAFDHFARHAVEVAVIEVGMGGRLDSTNIIMPQLSVITNISYDHVQFLGDTLPLIAGEKAGIIKRGVAVVIGETHIETESVFQLKAAEKLSPIFFADQRYVIEDFETGLAGTKGLLRALTATPEVPAPLPKASKELPPQTWNSAKGIVLMTDLTGNYQQRNLITIWQAAELLPQVGFGRVTPSIALAALQNVKASTRFFGRWQVLQYKPLVVADSAHNEAGLSYAMRQLTDLPHRCLRMVVGMVADKNISRMLALLPRQATYYFCKADIPRGLAADVLATHAAEYGLFGRVCASVGDAFQTALNDASPDDVVYVGGSTFVVAEVI